MKYLTITIDKGISNEMTDFLPKLDAFMKESGFSHKMYYTYNENNPDDLELLEITLDDSHNSKNITKIKEYCKEREWKKPFEIAKSSKNVVHAYMKAEKMLTSMEGNPSPTDEDLTDMNDLEEFMEYLKDSLMNDAVREYMLDTGRDKTDNLTPEEQQRLYWRAFLIRKGDEK